MEQPFHFLVELAAEEIFQPEDTERVVDAEDEPELGVWIDAEEAERDHNHAQRREDDERRADDAPFQPPDQRAEQHDRDPRADDGGPHKRDRPARKTVDKIDGEGRRPEHEHVGDDEAAERLCVKNRPEDQKPQADERRGDDQRPAEGAAGDKIDKHGDERADDHKKAKDIFGDGAFVRHFRVQLRLGRAVADQAAAERAVRVMRHGDAAGDAEFFCFTHLIQPQSQCLRLSESRKTAPEPRSPASAR